jgi:hypothetical protein
MSNFLATEPALLRRERTEGNPRYDLMDGWNRDWILGFGGRMGLNTYGWTHTFGVFGKDMIPCMKYHLWTVLGVELLLFFFSSCIQTILHAVFLSFHRSL